MPMVDDGINPAFLQLIAQQTALGAQRDRDQIDNLMKTSRPGQTVGELGITPKRFAKMFGKDVPFDPMKVIVDEKAADVTDKDRKALILGMTPEQRLNLAASLTQNISGVGGFTTKEGLLGQMKTGGIRDVTAANVATATQPVVQSTAIQQANTAAKQAETAGVKAGTELLSAKDVADRVNLGIASMRQASVASQKALNQMLAFGKTESAIQSDEVQNQLKIASVNEVLAAQMDPKHPMNAFLAKNGLDIHTTMAASTMGVANLLDNYSRSLFATKANNQEAGNIMLRARLDFAKTMSETVFKGKLTPNQVATIVDDAENGRPPRKGYEAAYAIYNKAIDANYQAAVSDALQKGDPMAIAAKTAIDNFGRLGKDPRQLEAANELSRHASAELMTKLQLGERTAENSAAWQKAYDGNYNRIVTAKVHVNWGPNEYEITGPKVAPPGAPAAGPVMPTTPISAVPAVKGMMGGQDATAGTTNPTGQMVPAPDPNTLSADQQASLAAYLKSIGMVP